MATCDFDNLATGSKIGKNFIVKVAVTRVAADGDLTLKLKDTHTVSIPVMIPAGSGSLVCDIPLTHALPFNDDTIEVELRKADDTLLDSDVASLVDVVDEVEIGVGTVSYPFVSTKGDLPNITGTYKPPQGRGESVLIEVAKKVGTKDKKGLRVLVLKSATWSDRTNNGITESVWEAILPKVEGDKLYVRVYLLNKDAEVVAVSSRLIK